MSKMSQVVANLTRELTKKSRNELIFFSRSLGVGSHSNKAKLISLIVAKAQKNQKIEEQVRNYIKPTEPTIPKIPTPIAPIQNSNTTTESLKNGQTDFYLLSHVPTHRKLDQKLFDLNAKILQSYCRAHENIPLNQLLKNQVLPFDDHYLKIVLEREQARQNLRIYESVVSKQKQKYQEGRGGGNKRLYVHNDLSENRQSESDLSYKQFLNSLQIQSQLVYPFYLAQKTHEMTKKDLLESFIGQDVYSLNNYINNELPERIRMYTTKSAVKNKIYKVSEAVYFMSLIKEQSYNDVDYVINAVKEISGDFSQKRGKQSFQTSNQLFVTFEKYAKYYEGIFGSISGQMRRRLIFRINEAIEGKAGEQGVVRSYFFPHLVNIVLKVCKIQLQSEEQVASSKIDPIPSILQLSRKAISLWAKCCQNKTVYSAPQLQVFLQGLKNVEQLILAIESHSGLTQISSVQMQAEYENIAKQILYSFQNILQSSTTSSVIQSNVLNSIISTFQAVFNESSIPTGLIGKCVLHGWNLKNKLQNRTRKSLIRLLSNREMIGSDIIAPNVVQDLLQLCVDLDTKEALLAIQLVEIYQLPEEDKLVRDLILCNIDPHQVDQDTTNYFKKIVMERVNDENIRKQILLYLQ